MSPFAGVAGSVILALAVAVLPAPAAGEPSPAAPLRNEDVVRMLVGGRSPAEVIKAIRSADVAFDLSDDMTRELRLASVPAEVLSAMGARQAEQDRKRATETPPVAAPQRPAEGKSLVVVSIGPPAGGRGTRDLVFPARLDDDDARALLAGASAEERVVTDLAVFLACRTPDHVPDQWRSRSPLGRDFVSVPRHEMLDFHPGASRVPARTAPSGYRPAAPRHGPSEAEPDLLAIALPIELRGEVDPGIPHDLIVGVAIRVGDRFLELAEAQLDRVVAGAEGLSLSAVVTERGEKGTIAIDVRIKRDGAPGPPPR
ncbi:MAG: hypothetical protein LAO51_19520 [Acidobacteriia bacterium]|nr:hypothetical protein [Terriglobia bacterium]